MSRFLSLEAKPKFLLAKTLQMGTILMWTEKNSTIIHWVTLETGKILTQFSTRWSLQTYLLNSISTGWILFSIIAVENKNMISLFLCFSKPFDSHSQEYICIVLCHIKGSREAVTGAMALPLGLHFKGEKQFPRFTSKQLALVPLPFLCGLLRTT